MFDKKIKVLVVDDSLVFRSYLSNSLKKDDEIEVVGTAMNGKTALTYIPLLKPDICTLDIEMPGMNGIETLRKIRELYPFVRVIMVSSRTSDGADITLQCLEAGARDFVFKEDCDSSFQSGNSLKLSQTLIRKIKKIYMTPSISESKSGASEMLIPNRSREADAMKNLIIPGSKPLFLLLCCEESQLGYLLLLVRNLSQSVTIPILFKIMVPDIFLTSLIKSFERNNPNYSYKIISSSSCYLEPRTLYLFGEKHQFCQFQYAPILKTEVLVAHEKITLDRTFRDLEKCKLPNTPIFLIGDDPAGDGINGLSELTKNGYPTVYATKWPVLFMNQKNVLAHVIVDITLFGTAINEFAGF